MKLAQKIEGRWTLDSFSRELGISREKAIYVIHRLRKLGYVKTYYGRNKMRIYYIYLRNQSKKKSYTDAINEVSPIKLAEWSPDYVYGRKIKYEEVLVYALKKRDVRYTIAALALFRHIKDWSYLYALAKKEGVVREIAALYDIARLFLKKLRKMPARFYNLALKDRGSFEYIIDKLSSDDFKSIEKKWKVYIPLNASDLSEYKRGAKS